MILSLYIDPGTGSMLFTVIIGVVAALLFAVKGLFIKLKYFFSGGKAKAETGDKIPFVIYTDSKRYWNVFEPICDEFERRKVKLTYMTQSEDDPVFSKDYKYITGEFIGAGNSAFAKLNVLQAGTVLSTTPSLDVYQWKRSKGVDKYVFMFHDASEGTIYEMFAMDYYDAIMLTGEFQGDYIRRLEKMRNLPAKDIYTTGCTYLDGMKKRFDIERNSDTASMLTGRKQILLAPSWGESSTLNRFGADILNALVKTGYDIVVRPHPQMKISDAALLDKLMKQFPDNEHFSWNFDNDNFDVLRKSDLMITDFSGVMCDYALVFDRPLVYADTHIDLSTYDACWIDEPVWRMQILPTIGKCLDEKDFPDMKEVLDSVMASDTYREGRKNVREKVWQYVGESAERTVDYLLGEAK